ncbi:LysM peptidoglycan-binding domain-containing protein [Arthrobacter sp. GCM10027362]|uniref:LysM peptidoglycan-binding domain-containing protein n=1 Tax=Arthrobacter sp. GCM10027362 TaxID=3273379 RepID=UPI003627DC65
MSAQLGAHFTAHFTAQLAAQPAPVKPVRSTIRLTRRGRLVLAGLPLMLGAGLMLLLAGAFSSPAKASGALSAPETVRVTVGAGQTLWDISTSVAPQRHPQEVIAEIVQLNNLEGTIVHAGQQVFVPSSR